MSYNPLNPNGQATAANSSPVVLPAAQITTLANDGTDGTTPPAVLGSGTGIRGWLRSIYEKLTGTLAVTGTFFQATQPVSMATNTPDVTDRSGRLLGTIANTSFAATNAGTFAVQAASTLAAETTKVIGTVNVAAAQTIAVTGTFYQATQPVSASALPLPTGASTAAKQPALGTAGAASTDVLSVQGIAGGVAQPVSGTFYQATQPVSIATMPSTPVTGTFYQATQPVSAVSLPLPTGAAQDGTDITTPTAMPTGGVGIRGWLSAIWTKLNGSLAVTGTFFQTTQPVSAASLPLPTGASTETTLAALNTKVPAQGQALAAASTPVVLTAAQVTTLTPPAAITGFNLETTQALIKAKTDNLDVALSTRATEGTDGTTPPTVLGGGTGIRGWLRSIYEKLTGTLAVTGTFFQATQPVSMATNTPDVTDRSARLLGTIANTAFIANAGTNLNTSALALDATLTGGTLKAIARGGAKGTAVAADLTSSPVDANTQALHVNLAGTNAVNATLTAETTKVIGTVNVAAAQTLATVTTVSAVTAITNALPTGANVIGALTANQSVNKAQINGVVPLMGNGITGTGSQRVTIASDNTAFAVNSTLTAETTKVIGTVNVAATQTIAVTQATASNLNATVTPIAITKGTQGATGYTTQDLKDAGRNAVTYYTLIPVLSSATDTLQSLTGTKSGATVAATTTPAVVTTAKTFRVTRVAATYIATATSGYGIVRLRYNTAGVVAITSPVAVTFAVGSSAPATANATDTVESALDEGWEFAAATGIGISVQGFAAATATAVGYVMVSVTGYEY